MASEFLLVGLGNPGPQYAQHRHNVGFLVLDALALAWHADPWREKWQAQVSRTSLQGSRITLVKPQSYMNRSGSAVAEASRFYKVAGRQIVVLHDDLDMHPGRLKLVYGGGAGGHNGIRSITAALGHGDFYRLKFGIGRPGKGEVHPDFPVDRYVLTDLSDAEQQLLKDRLCQIQDGLSQFIADGPGRAMNLLNSVK